MPKITYHFAGQTRTVETPAGKTLLQIALDNGIPMEHACGGNGFCTTCLCKVREGAANLGPATDREQMMGVEGDERLGCQAIAQGDVTVEMS